MASSQPVVEETWVQVLKESFFCRNPSWVAVIESSLLGNGLKHQCDIPWQQPTKVNLDTSCCKINDDGHHKSFCGKLVTWSDLMGKKFCHLKDVFSSPKERLEGARVILIVPGNPGLASFYEVPSVFLFLFKATSLLRYYSKVSLVWFVNWPAMKK